MNKGIVFFVLFLVFNVNHQAIAHDEIYDPEARLAELGIELPPPPSPVANYVNGVRTGNLIFLAGKGPKYPDGHELHGKLDAEVTIEQGYDGARMTAINQMAVLKSMLGNLNKVVRIVKVFGERGRHARAAVGMASLPRGQSVEIEMIVEVSD